MSGVPQILVSAPVRRGLLAIAAAALLAGCGQKGPLYLPTGEAAAGRRPVGETLLPDVLSPGVRAVQPAQAASSPPIQSPEPLSQPPMGTASPVRGQP